MHNTKLCECGCGQETVIGKRGIQLKFVKGHNKGKFKNTWKGGKIKDSRGYILIHLPNHPNANRLGYVFEHTLVLEKHFGRRIERTENAHHIDGNPSNNDIGNLILFKTASMHHGYHERIKALNACGHPDWHKCSRCHQWDSLDNLRLYNNGQGVRHRRRNYKCITNEQFKLEGGHV